MESIPVAERPCRRLKITCGQIRKAERVQSATIECILGKRTPGHFFRFVELKSQDQEVRVAMIRARSLRVLRYCSLERGIGRIPIEIEILVYRRQRRVRFRQSRRERNRSVGGVSRLAE